MAYVMPTQIQFGEGSVQQLPGIIAASRTVAFFHGKKSYEANREKFGSLLAGKTVTHFDNIEPEPEVSSLEAITEQLRNLAPDVVVAVGGGSVIDAAKGAAFCARQNKPVGELLAGSETSDFQHSVPVIAIPTTAGTGSEVTPFAVFWQHEAKKKHSFGYQQLYPEHAVVDPELTYSMPPDVTANTGMDAFTQACEAYWNANHNPTSDQFALEAATLILPALPRAVADGSDKKARHDMMLGSLRAGQAFSNTRTAACHSISYPMTLYFGVPHGQAVGVTLPEVLLFNAEAMPERVAAFCTALNVESMPDAAEAVRHMMEDSYLLTSLGGLGIGEKGIDIIVEHGFTPERMKNNPYKFTKDSLRTMLLKLL